MISVYLGLFTIWDSIVSEFLGSTIKNDETTPNPNIITPKMMNYTILLIAKVNLYKTV